MTEDDLFRRERCRLCDSRSLSPFLEFGKTALAGGFLRPEDVTSERLFPLTLAFCTTCFEVQLVETVSPSTLFSDYRFLASTTKSLSDHFAKYAKEMAERLLPKEGALVVEFGSNDGVLLKPFGDLGVRAVGVEPASNIARVAQARGCTVVNDFFGTRTAARVREAYGPADLVCANNVFAHIDDMVDIVKGVDLLLKDSGAFVFEVHYLLDLLEGFQYDMVYHEHLMYHALLPLARFLSANGLEVFDVERNEIHCGSIRVCAQKVGVAPRRDVQPAVLARLEDEREKGLDRLETFQRFGAEVFRRRDALWMLVRSLAREGKRIVGYGASGRASVHMNLGGDGARVLEYVVDASPERQGRLMPGVHTPIVSPDRFRNDHPDYAVLFAYNYLEEISRKEAAFVTGGGRFILPAPEPRIAG